MNVRVWLVSLGLEQYANAFAKNDIDPATLITLTADDLKDIGIASVGHRRRLLNAIAQLGGNSVTPTHSNDTSWTVSTPEAERRQLTVMFCDMVGSTALSEALDPEDLRKLMGDYQNVAEHVVESYEGEVAQYRGDGIMANFGWPIAHEDDAERAVRAALEIVQQVRNVKGPSPIQVRIGIATGLVVVGAGDSVEPRIAVGETPNLAARLQGLADVDEIVIGPMTRNLVGGIFNVADIGLHTLKGFAEPVRAHRVDGLARVEGRFEARGQPLVPFFGRDAELEKLLSLWERAKASEGQVVLLEGESGFGKSRLLRELCERIKSDVHAEMLFQCSPYHMSSALYPAIDYIERSAGFEPADNVEIRLDKLEDILVGSNEERALFAAILNLESKRYAPLGLTPHKQKERTLRALFAQLDALSQKSAVVFLIEDAHWIDPTTREALDLMLSELRRLRVIAIVTYRSEFKAPWLDLPHATFMQLARLGRQDASGIVESVGGVLPKALRERIVAMSDGVPLFVEELTNAACDCDFNEQSDGQVKVDSDPPFFAIPSTLHDSLAARLDRLGPAKELAQIAACIGRNFSRELLGLVKGISDEAFGETLSALVRSGLVYPEQHGDGSSFAFKHSLIQQAAYSALLSSRRRKIHADIAAALVAMHGTNQSSDPIVIARHLRAADQIQEALPWLRRAAERAANAGSIQESMEILNRSLELVPDIKGTEEERQRAELDIRKAMLPVCVAISGWGSQEAEQICSKALNLSIALGDKDMESDILYQIATMHEVRGEYNKTQAVLARRHRILAIPPKADSAVESGELMACSTFYQGRFGTSIEHATLALRYADPQKHTVLGATLSEDPTIACLFWLAKALLLQGRINQARARHREAFEIAQRSPNWYAKSQAEIDAALICTFQRDYSSAFDYANRAIESSARVGLAYREAVAALICEWANANTNDRLPDLGKVQESLSAFRQFGAMIGYEFYLALATEAYARVGDYDQADKHITEALESCGRNRGFFYESELHRTNGDLKLAISRSNSDPDAEACYQRGIRVARAQGALLFELRSAISLARIWFQRGERARARELLAPLYAAFTEGFDTADLINARALLDEIG